MTSPKTKTPRKRKTKALALAPIGGQSPDKLAGLTESQKELVTRHAQAQVALGAKRPPAFKDVTKDGAVSHVAPDPEQNRMLFFAQLSSATGSPHSQAAVDLLTDLHLVYASKQPKDLASELQTALAHMLDIGPRDGFEGMLAAQMVATHRVAMRKLARAQADGQAVEVSASYINQASRLMRLFSLQMDALNKHRGKGPSEQVVRVEHVTVQAGAQAVIGNVTAPPKLEGGQG